MKNATRERGGFVMGVVAGLLVGLALALGVALYITKAPVPFVNKVPQRTAEQDNAEAERNRNWDPNGPLGGRPGTKPATAATAGTPPAAASGVLATAPQPPAVIPGALPLPGSTTPGASAPGARPLAPPPPAPQPGKDPAAILAGATPATPAPSTKPVVESFVFFVQAGAFSRSEDAEQQRAKLALMGQQARITEREQAGRVVYRVRLGPYPSREGADELQSRLQEQGLEAQIVRVEKP